MYFPREPEYHNALDFAAAEHNSNSLSVTRTLLSPSKSTLPQSITPKPVRRSKPYIYQLFIDKNKSLACVINILSEGYGYSLLGLYELQSEKSEQGFAERGREFAEQAVAVVEQERKDLYLQQKLVLVSL